MSTRTIELTNVVPPVRGRFRTGRFFFSTFKTVAICAVVSWVVLYGAHEVIRLEAIARDRVIASYASFIGSITRVEVVKEYIRPASVPLDQVIPTVARDFKVPVVALRAVIDQESSGGEYLYRFEPDKYADLKAKSRLSDSEVRMLASSHGPAHVMGFNAMPRCGIHWSKLYDSLLGVECGARILRENLNRHAKVKSPSERLALALRDYNGSGPAAEAYSQKVMARVGALLFGQLQEEL